MIVNKNENWFDVMNAIIHTSLAIGEEEYGANQEKKAI
jgi:hypothetical protein